MIDILAVALADAARPREAAARGIAAGAVLFLRWFRVVTRIFALVVSHCFLREVGRPAEPQSLNCAPLIGIVERAPIAWGVGGGRQKIDDPIKGAGGRMLRWRSSLGLSY